MSSDDGTPAAGSRVVITSLATGGQASAVTTDRDGRFQSEVPEGEYAVSAVTEHGFAWIENHAIPDTSLQVALSRACHRLTGRVRDAAASAVVAFARKSAGTGDTFVAHVRADGSFALCLPAASYTAVVSGDTLSLPIDVEVPATTTVQIAGIPTRDVEQRPPAVGPVAASLATLVEDIAHANPTLIGMGEATHGTAEFAEARGQLTLELIRSAEVRLVLLEVDAIAAAALDDYVNGAEVDLAKAVAALGFWVTDTHEFLHFLEQVRRHNAGASDRVHIWGIDAQNTALPVEVLMGNAARLSIDDGAQASLHVAAAKRGKDIASVPPAQRSALDAVLSRLAVPRGHDRDDLLVAVAARSLAIQLAYWEGDMRGRYRTRRDAGMAKLASFITAELGARRACLWAHDAHVAQEGATVMLGQHLAADPSLRYYGIGFYLYEGSTRAWDGAAKIGVISHPIPAAPPYTVEGAVMQVTGMPEIAWLPFRTLPAPLQTWLSTPRFVREVGAQYQDVDSTMTLRHIRQAFHAVVVVKHGHDSSPTPTGIRTAKHD